MKAVRHCTAYPYPRGRPVVGTPSGRHPFTVPPPQFSIAARAVARVSSICPTLAAAPPPTFAPRVDSPTQVDLTNTSDEGSPSVDDDESGTYYERGAANPLSHAEVVVTELPPPGQGLQAPPRSS